jgi:hypothetical protein
MDLRAMILSACYDCQSMSAPWYDRNYIPADRTLRAHYDVRRVMPSLILCHTAAIGELLGEHWPTLSYLWRRWPTIWTLQTNGLSTRDSGVHVLAAAGSMFGPLWQTTARADRRYGRCLVPMHTTWPAISNMNLMVRVWWNAIAVVLVILPAWRR